MKKRNSANPRRQPSARKTGSGSKGWRLYAVIFLCGPLLVAGFFLAGRQHFSSMDYGMKNSRLRKQLDDLESEKRRLLLQREVAQSPSEIKKSARRAGFNDSAAAVPEIAKLIPEARPKETDASALPVKNSGVVKTVQVTAVHASLTSGFTGRERIARQTKKDLNAE